MNRAIPGRGAATKPSSVPAGRARIIVFVVLVTLVLAGTAGYLVRARLEQTRRSQDARPLPQTDLAQLENKPRIVFRSNSRAHYGVIAMVAIDDPAGPRAITSTSCARLYASEHEVLCVSLDRIAVIYKTDVLDDQLHVRRSLPLGGIPSRTRLSADGTLAATTAFANVGDSYTTTDFSTRTYISSVGGAGKSTSLEDFALYHQGRRISPVDRNFWGVTFAADDNLFYATVRFAGHTWLVSGDLGARTVTTVREDAECPSLSPDGRRLVYKKRDGRPAGQWRLTSLDLATGRETKLAETRSVDDQVEWLDDGHVIYGVPGSDGDPDISDVYSVPVDGSGRATVLIKQASSPAVVR